jgi:hypothetical protein
LSQLVSAAAFSDFGADLMGRKNNRTDSYEPLDLTSFTEDRMSGPRNFTLAERRQRADDQREREERQRNARQNRGIDWSICLVPGCGADIYKYGRTMTRPPEWRNHKVSLPLCLEHLWVAFHQAKSAADNDLEVCVQANALVQERRQAMLDAGAEAERKARLANTSGHIYAVRHNGLIKVGWSRDVHQRIHSYGPDVQVLCIYKGTRDDETNLHRQLKPARARGREWYEDGPILADFIAKAVEQHGEPEARDYWSRPAAPTPRTHRSSRRRAGP